MLPNSWPEALKRGNLWWGTSGERPLQRGEPKKRDKPGSSRLPCARRLTWWCRWGPVVPVPTSPKPATTRRQHPLVQSSWPPSPGWAGAWQSLRSAAPSRAAQSPRTRPAWFKRTRELAGVARLAENRACPVRWFFCRLLPAGNRSSNHKGASQGGKGRETERLLHPQWAYHKGSWWLTKAPGHCGCQGNREWCRASP